MTGIGNSIDIRDCAADNVLVRDDTLIDLFRSVRKSQKSNSWETGARMPHVRRGGLGSLLSRALKRPAPMPSGVLAVGGVILKVPDDEELASEDICDGVELLYELSRCPVPRLDGGPSSGRQRHVFFSDTEHWQNLFPQLHAIWSKKARVVVFYGWGHVESFYRWAVTFQPDLATKLDSCVGQIIVVVPSIRRITRQLLAILEAERNRIWSEPHSM